MTALDIVLIVIAAALSASIAVLVVQRRPPKRPPPPPGARRILVPFTGALEPRVLDAAIRIAQAQGAVLVPAYLLVVPLQFDEDSPLTEQVAVAMPVLEAVELAALRAGVPVDARIEKGRTLTHALRRLWEVEPFDEIVAPAPANGHAPGFTEKSSISLFKKKPVPSTIKPEPKPKLTVMVAATRLPSASNTEKCVVCGLSGTLFKTPGSASLEVARSRRIEARCPAA